MALSPGRPESLLATILPFGVRTFFLSPLAGRRGDRLAHSGRYLYTVVLEFFIEVRPRRVNLPGKEARTLQANLARMTKNAWS